MNSTPPSLDKARLTPVIALSPLPSNFDRWPKTMQDRYRRQNLDPLTPS